jgi:very-short-patch-repair endonuclease
MKPLKFPTKKEESEYMRERKAQNRARIPWLKAERWFLETYLANLSAEPRNKFSRQASWGYRLFDFWFHDRGVVIEVDGPEHNKGYDAYRDKYNFLRSGIIVLRVRNFNAPDAERAIGELSKECSWEDRRRAMGLLTSEASRRGRRELADNSDWQEALRRIADAGLYCSYGGPTGPSVQPRLF